MTAITSLIGTAAGAALGSTPADVAQGSLNAKNAVENNRLISKEQEDAVNRYIRTFTHLSFRQKSLLRQRLLARLCARQDCHRGLSKHAPERNINEQLYAQGNSFSPSVTNELDSLINRIHLTNGKPLLESYTWLDRNWERGVQAGKAMAFGIAEGVLEPAATAKDVANAVVNVTTGSNRPVTNSMLGRKAAEGAGTAGLLWDVTKNTVTSHPVVAVGMGSYATTTGLLNDDPDQIGEGMAAVSGSFSYARAIGNPAYSVNVRVRGLPPAPPHIAKQRGAVSVPEINIRRINNQYSGKTPHTENVIGKNNPRYNEALQERITARGQAASGGKTGVGRQGRSSGKPNVENTQRHASSTNVNTKTSTGGENWNTQRGKEIHARLAEERRTSKQYDLVNEPINNLDGSSILVPRRVRLPTGEPVHGKGYQTAKPDAVIRDIIIDDKPVSRPISKDRQELIRFINAYQQKNNSLPRIIAIQRYDPKTGKPVYTEIYKPKEIAPWIEN